MMAHHAYNTEAQNIVYHQKLQSTCRPLMLNVSVSLCMWAFDINEHVTDPYDKVRFFYWFVDQFIFHIENVGDSY